MSMKTLHLTNAFHPTSGGIHTTYRAFLDAANRLGRHMRLIVPGDATRIEEVGPFGRIYYLAAPRAPVFDSSYRLILPHTYLLPGGAIRQILRDEQPDLVEISDKYSLNWLAGLVRKNWIAGVKRPVLIGLSCERM